MRNFIRKNDLFSKQGKENATPIDINEVNYQIEQKIRHRLHTCSYDIEKRNGKIYVYMMGVDNSNIQYFNLEDDELEKIWNIIRYPIANCELQDYYNRFIGYVSYKYICKKLAPKYPKKHRAVKKSMDGVTALADKVFAYLKQGNEQMVFGDEKEYCNLIDMQYRHTANLGEVRSFIKDNIVDFLTYDKKQFLFGNELKDIFVKFSYSENKKEKFKRFEDGKYYKFEEGKVVTDYVDGCGFSFGELNKAFYYFQCGFYGEQLMFVRTLPKEKYYKQEYEYLGRKIKIEKIGLLSDVENVRFILKNMKEDEKKIFFNNISCTSFSNAFGSVKETVEIMQEYQKEYSKGIYQNAIEYLLNESKKYEGI